MGFVRDEDDNYEYILQVAATKEEVAIKLFLFGK